MKKHFVMLTAAVLLTTLCAAASASLYYTTGSGVRVRSGPGTGYQILANLAIGTKLDVLQISHGWARVTLWTGSDEGFVSTKYISKTKPTSSGSASSGSSGTSSAAVESTTSDGTVDYSGFKSANYTVVVNPKNTYVNMRWEASKTSQIRRVYYLGAELRVVAENNYWCQVIDDSTGEVGFILKSLLLKQADEQG